MDRQTARNVANEVADQRWVRQYEHMDGLLAPVSHWLFEAAAPAPGMRIIDIGCGCGDTSLELAVRAAPGGHVLGIDISETMLAVARRRARAVAAVEFALADATTYAFEPVADLMVSRFGVMFFADPALSFANMRRGLKPGGRLVFACWRDLPLCTWLSVPYAAILEAFTLPAPEAPKGPGAFSLSSSAATGDLLEAAGFEQVVFRQLDVTLDLAAGRGLSAAIKCAMEIGPTNQLIAQLPDGSDPARVIGDALGVYLEGASVPLRGAIWIVSALNPSGPD
jgi:SAM-dependent methyltransferase